jgi:hypothetical protein
MKTSICLMFVIAVAWAGDLSSQVVLSEVMFDASGSEAHDEFVEIYNSSDAEVDLTGWQLSDGTGFDTIIEVDQGFILQPGQFGLILDGSYFDNSTAYNHLIPENCLVLKIGDSAFGSAGLSNSTPEAISIIDAFGAVVSEYVYSLDNVAGFSDEKIDPAGPNTPENWANSRVALGTPGARNSVSPLDYDLAIFPEDITFSPSRVLASESVAILGFVKNIGLLAAANFSLVLYEDQNSNAVPDFDEELARFAFPQPLASGDSADFEFFYENVAAGQHALFAVIEFSQDEFFSNNVAQTDLLVGHPAGTVVINEIMYSPQSGEPEWVEIFNPGSQVVGLTDWPLTDSDTAAPAFIETEISIAPGGYFVLAQDSLAGLSMPVDAFAVVANWPTLNNDLDSIVLSDFSGNLIDRVDYESGWGNARGFSLEKIDHAGPNTAKNWANSRMLLGTPGSRNSVSPQDYDLAISPDLIFSPQNIKAGESVTISASVKNVGLQTAINYSAILFEDQNANESPDVDEELARLSFDALAPGDSIPFDFHYANVAADRHLLFVVIEFADDRNLENNLATKELLVGYPAAALVVNEIMYSPLSDQPEWVEVFNQTSGPANLRGWRLTDSDTTASTPVEVDAIVPPNGYFVLAQDSLTGPLTPPDGTSIILRNWPSLNNNSESAVLFDLIGSQIDRVNFTSDWGGASGFSLEKINPRLPANDSLNWSTSVVFAGGTPGEQNSIFADVLVSDATISISPNPFSPDGDAHDDFTVINFKLPVTTAAVNVKIYDMRGRLIRFLANNESSGSEKTLVWDGRDNDQRLARVGIYVVYLQALNARAGLVLSEKKTVVLANKL